MTAPQPLAGILSTCERLRRLPAARWQQPPRPPLGALPAGAVPASDDEPLAQVVRRSIEALMLQDAADRSVRAFTPRVPDLALPDVLAALARSVSASGSDAGRRVLDEVASRCRDW